MARRQLRVFPGPDRELPVVKRPEVHIRLREMLPLVAMAQRMNFVWLQDFLDDEVCVSEDLYEVLQAFRASRRPGA